MERLYIVANRFWKGLQSDKGNILLTTLPELRNESLVSSKQDHVTGDYQQAGKPGRTDLEIEEHVGYRSQMSNTEQISNLRLLVEK